VLCNWIHSLALVPILAPEEIDSFSGAPSPSKISSASTTFQKFRIFEFNSPQAGNYSNLIPISSLKKLREKEIVCLKKLSPLWR
jgi:hypothetical protein